jgi:hypothetical protein
MQKLFLAFILIHALESAKTQVLPSFGNSRTATTGMQFLKISADARASGLAGSYITIADNAGAAFWNPAALTRISPEPLQFHASQGRYFGGFHLQNFGVVLRRQQSFWGVTVFSMNSPEMLETTEFQPKGTGRSFKSSSYHAGINYARILTNSFSFGLNGKYAREDYGSVYVQNVLFDLGLHYNVGIKNIKFAITLSNFGINVQPGGEVMLLKFDGNQAKKNFEEISVPAIFRLGASLDILDIDKHKITLASQLNHPTDNNETMSVGVEYLMRKVLFVRTGYEFGQDINSFPPLGLGVLIKRKFGSLGIDYSLSNLQMLGNVHRLSLNLAINKK